jgi:hypothetical protein
MFPCRNREAKTDQISNANFNAMLKIITVQNIQAQQALLFELNG